MILANALMVQNLQDYQGVRALAAEMGVECTLDPTIPMMDGDRSVLKLGADQETLRQVFRDKALVGDVGEFCAIAEPADETALSALPCSAGHTACYVSPYGDVYPCVQFPLPTGNVRKQRFLDIWRHSERMNLEFPRPTCWRRSVLRRTWCRFRLFLRVRQITLAAPLHKLALLAILVGNASAFRAA